MEEKYRNWEITINNPTVEEITALKNETTRYTYISINEGNEEHTEHVHALLCYTCRRYVNNLKKILPRAHIGYVKSLPGYWKYLTDEHETVKEKWESGVKPLDQTQKGEKMKHIWKRCIKYANRGDIEKIAKKYPAMYVCHYTTWKKLQKDHPVHCPPRSELDNIWVWGETGTFKSRPYREAGGEDVFYPKPLSKWWDGYRNEKNVIIEDLAPDNTGRRHWITDLMKVWTDHYEFVAEDKNGSRIIRPQKIVVTSNYPIEEVFRYNDKEDVAALKRRFKVFHTNKITPK